MSSLKIKLNREGVRQMLQSEEMQNLLRERAETALASLGEGYEVTTRVGKNRANASIKAATYKARKDNLKNNSILKALR